MIRMKILLVNKFLYPKGGAETYVFKLGAALQQRGHDVEYFGLESEKNIVHNRIGAYVTDIDFGKGICHNLTAPLRIIYSREARKKIRRVLNDFQPDVVHVNNIQYHLTPSILLEVAAYRKHTGRTVKLVYTAHDYQLICPSHGLLGTNVQPCEKCLGGNYTHCLRTKCLKNSYSRSLLGMLDAYYWKHSKAYSHIDTIICCSNFLKSKLDTQARFRDKTVALHNFIEAAPLPDVAKEDYVLEFGHLSRDKGTDTLLKVAQRMPETRFVFAGYGESVAHMEGIPNVEYVGFQTGAALRRLIACAAVSVCPSEQYENCPFSVLESLLLKVPVIGARIGGIPELIQEGTTGELFEAGNDRDLERALRQLLQNPEKLRLYTENCNNLPFETPETYCDKLMRFYAK